MVIKIDTELKTINIESFVKLKDLIEFLEKNIKDWDEYTVIATTTSYSYPIIYQPTKPWEPYDPPYKVTCQIY